MLMKGSARPVRGTLPCYVIMFSFLLRAPCCSTFQQELGFVSALHVKLCHLRSLDFILTPFDGRLVKPPMSIDISPCRLYK